MATIKITPPAGEAIVGIHEWNRETYDRCEALNWSKLSKWDDRDRDFCPAEAIHAEQFTETTDAMIFGTRLHSRVLTPDEFEIDYAVEPDLGPLKSPMGKATAEMAPVYKANKMARDSWRSLNAKKEWINKADGEQIEVMRNAVRNHPVAGPLLELPSRRELTVISELKDGTLTKCLLDLEVEVPDNKFWRELGFEPGLHIADLKSTSASVSPDSWGRSVAKWKYHGQGASYTDSHTRATGKKGVGFIFIPVCKSAPYSVATYAMTAQQQSWGRKLYARCRKSRQRHIESGKYPGHTPRLVMMQMPEWSSEGDDF